MIRLHTLETGLEMCMLFIREDDIVFVDAAASCNSLSVQSNVSLFAVADN